jgi:ribose transport system permease protein
MTTTSGHAAHRAGHVVATSVLHGRLGVTRAGVLYVWALLIVLFTVWRPGTFPTMQTVTQVMNQYSVSGLMALALVLPLACGVFDLSIGYTMTVSSVTVAWCLGPQGMSTFEAISIALLLCLAIGIVNAIVVVVLKIDSFIGTLATGSALQALVLIISGNQQMIEGVSKLSRFTSHSFLTFNLPVFVMFGVAVAFWVLLSHTATGRHMYAAGLGSEQARLAGVAINRLRFASFLGSALLAGLAGVAVTGLVGAGSPTVGPPYLIPAFAAAFLGATQFKDGLFNAWGTVVATLMLGTADIGLALAQVPAWTPYLFSGGVLLLALALRGLQSSGRLVRRSQSEPDQPPTVRPSDEGDSQSATRLEPVVNA